MRDISSPLDGFSSPFGPQRNRTLQSLLFGQTEPGFTFEPWDITTLFQDRAGTTPVTAAGQSVGYRRDKSGRGNHEVAVSDAKRGIYGWMPKTGRRNLLTHTEQFSNSAWALGGSTLLPNNAVAPDGTTTADKISEDSTTGVHRLLNNAGITVSSGVTYTWSVYVKASERSVVRFINNNLVGATFDLDNGAASSNISAGITPAAVSVGNGWYRLSISGLTATTIERLVVQIVVGGTTSYTGVTGSGIFVWGAQLEVGSTATAYQRVVSQYDITEAGVQTCYYVQADGVDDAYVTPTITPNTDKAQVFAGVRKLSDASLGILLETSSGALNGTFTLAAPEFTAPRDGHTWESRGSGAAQVLQVDGYPAPRSLVITGQTDLAAPSMVVRTNGVQTGSSTPALGGNFLAYPAYIYARGGTSLPFNGLDFGHAVRFGPNLDAATIARVESLIARNTPEVTL